MRTSAILFLGSLTAFLAYGIAFAEPSEGKGGCWGTALTQAQITSCAAAEATASDKRLNAAYRDLLRYLDPAESRELAAAQRTWLAFRNADCAWWVGATFSLAPTNKLSCLADLSNARAKELESWPPNAPRSAVQPHR